MRLRPFQTRVIRGAMAPGIDTAALSLPRGFRLRALEKCRERYVQRRLAAGKTVGPRAPWAAKRGAIDTFLAAIRRNASGRLDAWE